MCGGYWWVVVVRRAELERWVGVGGRLLDPAQYRTAALTLHMPVPRPLAPPPVLVGTTETSVRTRASAVTAGAGLSGWCAATAVATCSAASPGLLPKWMTYLPASVNSSLPKPGTTGGWAGEVGGGAKIAQPPRSTQDMGLMDGVFSCGTATSPNHTTACRAMPCRPGVPPQLPHPPTVKIPVYEGQRAALLILQLKVPGQQTSLHRRELPLACAAPAW